jgi:phage/plasmid-like protein (TIGR03299 family)
MSHYFDTGMCVRRPSWHGLENLLAEAPATWEEARTAAGLDWEPIKVPAFAFRGIDADGQAVSRPGDGVVGDFFEEPDHERVIRSDTGSTLAIAKGSYQIISHADMGEMMDALTTVGFRYETAGSTHEGRRVWSLAYLDEPMTLPGDFTPTVPYMALTNAHDGSGACRAQYTSVRVVCANTWQMAEAQADRTGQVFTFRHTKNWRDKVEDARMALTGLRESQAEYLGMMEHLLGVRVTDAQATMFIREFVPMPPDGLISARVARNVEEARGALRTILASDTTAPVAGTAYGLVQAAGEYLDHVRGYRNRDTYLGRTLLRPEPLKFKALSLVREVVAAG